MTEPIFDPTWRTTSVAVPGSGHERRGVPCQDAVGVRELPNGRIIAIACDGAGSGARSEEGAAYAVAATLEWAVALPSLDVMPDEWRPAFLDHLRGLRETLLARSADLDVQLHDLATTLLVVIAEGERTLVGQLGDGGVALRAGGQWTCPTAAPLTDYVNETVFVTSDEGKHAAASTYVGSSAVDAIVVFTDGLERLCLTMPERLPHPPFFDPIVGLVQQEPAESSSAQIDAFLRSPTLRERTDDDCSIVVCTRVANAT